MNTTSSNSLVTLVQKQAPGFRPKVGLVLGSGLASIAEQIQRPIIIPYHRFTGFPVSQAVGHPGQLWLGYLSDRPVACYQGRVHSYEGANADDFKLFIRSLKLLGCEIIVLTNASGSLRTEFQPGQLVLIQDHINFQSNHPLVGVNNDEFGPRFFSMEGAYDFELQQILLSTAQQLGINLGTGVYMGVIGPSFETPAEIRAFRTLGADLVGMSTVPEVLVARHCGLRVVAISTVANLAAGMSSLPITHEATLQAVHTAVGNLSRLILASLRDFPGCP